MSKVFLSSINGRHTLEREYETSETVKDLKTFIIDHYKNEKVSKTEVTQDDKQNTQINGQNITVQELTTTTNIQDIVHKSIQIIYNGKIVRENVLLRSLSEGDLDIKFAIKELQLNKNLVSSNTMQENAEINKNENKIQMTNKNTDEIKRRSGLIEKEVEMKKIENLTYVKIVKNGEKLLVDPSKIITINKQLIYVTKRENVKNVLDELRSAIVNLKVDLIFKLGLVFALFLSGNYEFGVIVCAILSLKMLSTIKFKLKMKDTSRFGLNVFYSFFITLLLYHSDQILDYSECKKKE